MFSYFTQLKMKDNFNQERLLEMLFDWLNTTRNKMNGLEYHKENPFEYTVDKKILKIQDFTDDHHLGIQFTTTDNRGGTQFVVEIIYDYKTNKISLYFKKEFTETSKYLPGNSMPILFKNILYSDYVKIHHGPQFLNRNDYKKIKQMNRHSPLIVLWRNKKCCLDPFKLSDEMIGLGEVVCVPTKKDPSIQIVYPNRSIEDITFENRKQATKEIADKLQSYLIANYDICTFDDFINLQLQEEHKLYEDITSSTAVDFEETIENIKKEIQDIELQNEQLAKERLALQRELRDLEDLSKQYEKEYLLVSSSFENDDQKEILMELIMAELRVHNNTNQSRRRDILNSIVKEQSK